MTTQERLEAKIAELKSENRRLEKKNNHLKSEMRHAISSMRNMEKLPKENRLLKLELTGQQRTINALNAQIAQIRAQKAKETR